MVTHTAEQLNVAFYSVQRARLQRDVCATRILFGVGEPVPAGGSGVGEALSHRQIAGVTFF